MKQIGRSILAGLLLLIGSPLLAQPAAPDEPVYPQAAPSFLAITILGNPAISFGSISDYMNGVSANHSTLRLAISLGVSWSLQVRATGDLQNQVYSIPASAIGIQAVNIGSRPEIMLSSTDQMLASGLASSLLNQVTTFRYRAVGGSAFLKPAGNYTTTLIFTYTEL